MEDLDFFYSKPMEPDKKPKKGFRIKLPSILSKINLRYLPKVLTAKERYLLTLLVLIIAGSIIFIPIKAYWNGTKPIADYGGKYSEGIIGEPRFINPLLSQLSDADRDIGSIIYSGLMKNAGSGTFIPDLAERYEISSDGLTYTFYLKKNIKWHDGTPFSADDIVFTILAAQDPEYASSQRINWQGVEIEKIDDSALKFKLKNKYAQFLSNTTIGILPKHIWQGIKPINFSLSERNIKPIGTGPFKFEKLRKDSAGRIKSYELSAFKNYHNGRPYLDSIELKFYGSEEEMLRAYNRNDIDALSFISSNRLKDLKGRTGLDIKRLKLPRYFAIFINQSQSKFLSDKNVRLALAYSLDKNRIIDKILNGEAVKVDSPILPDIFEYNINVKTLEYNPDFAKEILKNSGWADKDNDQILEKNNEKLELELVTSNWPELAAVANLIKEDWEKIGIKLNLQVADISELQQSYIKERNYQMLLFGEILTVDPDPFSFWHSSQKKDPGLNLAQYDNKDADKFLEEARQTIDPLQRARKYDDFQKITVEDLPAIFLYSPVYLYPQPKNIKATDIKLLSVPSERFVNVEKWHINTKRVKK